MPDWIDTFIELTSGLRSPPIFRRWAAISTISGALQRRVWTETKTGTTYPSLYVMIAGPPGAGKSLAVFETRKLWKTVPGLFVGPDNPTKAALIARMSSSVRAYRNGKAEPLIFTSLAVPCEEFGNLISKYDMEFLAMLSHFWNNPPDYDVPRAVAESYKLEKPNMTIVAGVTPDTLGATFPEVAWGQGFTARLIFVYSERTQYDNKDIFKKRKVVEASPELTEPLAAMFALGGEIFWTSEAMDELISWMDSGMLPVPDHSRLKFYIERRFENILKLSMIAAVSAAADTLSEQEPPEVTLADFNRARSWLLEAEKTMPDVFRAMGQKSDLQVISDLHFYLERLYGRRALANRVPIENEIVWAHLADRVPSERIPRVIETAERGGWIRRAGGTGPPRWIPRPLNEVNTKLN